MQEILLTILTIITIIITGTMFYVGYKIYKLFFTPDMIDFMKTQIKNFDYKKFKSDMEETKKTIYRQMKNRK